VLRELRAALSLLLRTGRLARLGLATPSPAPAAPTGDGAIDESAAADVAGLGGEDFL
jgi:hypothetical protein